MIEVSYLGASHWHLPFYLEPAVAMDGVRVVGVADPDPEVARRLGERWSCAWSGDYAELCERTRPDFVFALRRHDAMAEEAAFLIDAGIPFAIEKPCGIDAGQVARVADAARRKGVFAAVPFVLRQSAMVEELDRRVGRGAYQYLSFRMIGRPVSRYFEEGSSWMVERRHAGGGAFVNLGIHFVDLFRYLCPGPVEVVSATLANAAWSCDVEDYGLAVLRAGPSLCTIETGYLYPGTREFMDLRYSLRAGEHYFSVHDSSSMEISDLQGHCEVVAVATTNVAYYGAFVRDVLRQFRGGEAPVAGLADAAEAMAILERIYALDSGGPSGPRNAAPGER